MSGESSLRSKVAIVTGGSRGIGLSIAEALLADGAAVVISGMSEDHLQQARRTLAGAGRVEPRLEAVPADVRKEADVERLVARTVERFGGVDILINNAASGKMAPLASMTTEEWNTVIDTNLTGVFF